MPIKKVYDDLGGRPAMNCKLLGAFMKAERDKRGYTNVETIATLMRERFGIPVDGRAYRKMETGGLPLTVEVLVAYMDIVRPNGGLSFTYDAMSQEARDAFGLVKL